METPSLENVSLDEKQYENAQVFNSFSLTIQIHIENTAGDYIGIQFQVSFIFYNIYSLSKREADDGYACSFTKKKFGCATVHTHILQTNEVSKINCSFQTFTFCCWYLVSRHTASCAPNTHGKCHLIFLSFFHCYKIQLVFSSDQNENEKSNRTKSKATIPC